MNKNILKQIILGLAIAFLCDLIFHLCLLVFVNLFVGTKLTLEISEFCNHVLFWGIILFSYRTIYSKKEKVNFNYLAGILIYFFPTLKVISITEELRISLFSECSYHELSYYLSEGNIFSSLYAIYIIPFKQLNIILDLETISNGYLILIQFLSIVVMFLYLSIYLYFLKIGSKMNYINKENTIVISKNKKNILIKLILSSLIFPVIIITTYYFSLSVNSIVFHTIIYFLISITCFIFNYLLSKKNKYYLILCLPTLLSMPILGISHTKTIDLEYYFNKSCVNNKDYIIYKYKYPVIKPCAIAIFDFLNTNLDNGVRDNTIVSNKLYNYVVRKTQIQAESIYPFYLLYLLTFFILINKIYLKGQSIN